MASQEEIYDKLWALRVPQNQLEKRGYPLPDSENPEFRAAPRNFMGEKIALEEKFAREYECKRCHSKFDVGEDGQALEKGTCRYHSTNFDKRPSYREWKCCHKGFESALGCIVATHAHTGSLLVENFRGFMATGARDDLEPNKHGIFALDCEMVDTAYGLELVRVSVLDYKGQTVYETLVKPANLVVNYNTAFNGLDAKQFDNVTTRLADVHNKLRSMFSSKTLLVGHGLSSDMKALKLFHCNFVDTEHLFPHPKGAPFRSSLKMLKEDRLQIRTIDGKPHDSVDDARHALQLAYLKAGISDKMATLSVA